MTYNAKRQNVGPDGLPASLAVALGIDLERALTDAQFRQLATEMTNGCAEHHCAIACARAIREQGQMSEPPQVCPYRNLLMLMQQKFPLDKPATYDDPFAHGRLRVAPVSSLRDPSIDDRD